MESDTLPALKGSYGDTGRAGGAAQIRVVPDIDRSIPPPELIDVTPEPQVIDHEDDA